MIRQGVYAIKNTVNGMVYVGSTKNFPHRWSNLRSKLNRGVIRNPAFQRDWDNIGPSAFEFTILHECVGGKLDRLTCEQEWIEKFGPKAYNLVRAILNTTPPIKEVPTDPLEYPPGSPRACKQCRMPFAPSLLGRPPTFCSTACRYQFWAVQNPDRVAYHRKARQASRKKSA